MAINRAQILKELEPGLNAIFGVEYNRYENEHAELFQTFYSSRAYEEDLLFTGFGAAPIKAEGTPVQYDAAREGWVARYQHNAVALAFALTREAVDDNLYDSLSTRLTKALARSMVHTKQVIAANVFNNGFNAGFPGGDGVALFHVSHPLIDGGTFANKMATDADLSEAALENALIAIAGFVDDRGLPIAVQARKLAIPKELVFVAERLLTTPNRVGTADNDINAVRQMSMFPDGYCVNHRFTDPDAWFVLTDVPDGMKHFERTKIETSMEVDFETINARYKAYERYSFGWSDPRGVWGSAGA